VAVLLTAGCCIFSVIGHMITDYAILEEEFPRR